MSMSNNLFRSEMPLGSYQEELMKCNETLMAGNMRSPKKRPANATSARSTRIFQFSGKDDEDNGGDCRQSGLFDYKLNYSKEHISSSDGMKFLSARGPMENLRNAKGGLSKNANISTWESSPRREQKRQEAGESYINSEEIDDVDLLNASGNANIFHTPSGVKNKNIDDGFNLAKCPRFDQDSVMNSTRDLKNDWNQSNTLDNFQITTPPKEKSKKNAQINKDSEEVNIMPPSPEMNYIVLLSLLMGITASKAIQYIHCYFGWILTQIMQLRHTFLGRSTLADLMNFDDNSRYSLRNKIVFLPVVAICCLIYGLLAIFNRLLCFLLTLAPRGLVAFVNKLYMD